MNIIEKVNRSRYTIKEILDDEWDVSTLADLSDKEIEIIYTVPSSKNSSLSSFGVASGCNFTLRHKYVPSHSLHVIYYNFPEIGRDSSKITKTVTDKIFNFYKSDLIHPDDNLFIIINDKVSQTLEAAFNTLNINLQNEGEISKEIKEEIKKSKINLHKRHFRNVHLFTINSFTNNLLKHRSVPEHTQIRDDNKIKEILETCNATKSQLPIILQSDIISKLKRLTIGDICEIKRNSSTCGEYPFYRICK